MLNENIKALRKSRGMSQETMANQLNVVRQTISKWEKGLSVPDADMLTKIADLFNVEVSELLGEMAVDKVDNMDDIAIQLALINDQLARKNNRSKKIIKIIIILMILFIIIPTIITIGGAALFGLHAINHTSPIAHTEVVCSINDDEYIYGIDYDENNEIITAGGDSYIADAVRVEEYGKADELVKAIEEYVTSNGGTVEIDEQDYDHYISKGN